MGEWGGREEGGCFCEGFAGEEVFAEESAGSADVVPQV